MGRGLIKIVLQQEYLQVGSTRYVDFNITHLVYHTDPRKTLGLLQVTHRVRKNGSDAE